MSEFVDMQGTEVRGDWKNFGDLPDGLCPLVLSTDTAHTAIETARDAGIITDKAAQQRLAILNLRRSVIAATQRQYGCPKQDVLEEAPNGATYVCELPTGLVESFAFGGSEQMYNLLEPNKNNTRTGFGT